MWRGEDLTKSEFLFAKSRHSQEALIWKKCVWEVGLRCGSEIGFEIWMGIKWDKLQHN